MQYKKAPKSIIISRTDSIGDVVLTLPMAGVIKEWFPDTYVIFMGKSYTRPVIDACKFVDEFLDIEDFKKGKLPRKVEAIVHVLPDPKLAQKAKNLKIPLRIGTTNRLYHWFTCNKLVKLSRRRSLLHEAQLNIKLLEPIGIRRNYALNEIPYYYGLDSLQKLRTEYAELINTGKYNVILHPKSQGSAREWGLDNFAKLVALLDPNKFKIFISGTAKERILLEPLFEKVGNSVTDICGLMDLGQFMSFIKSCDGLVANSTGPLHIAAALNKDAIGIYPPMRPIHPGRWAPLGSRAQFFVLDKDCEDCRKTPETCHCIKEILPFSIAEALNNASINKSTNVSS